MKLKKNKRMFNKSELSIRNEDFKTERYKVLKIAQKKNYFNDTYLNLINDGADNVMSLSHVDLKNVYEHIELILNNEDGVLNVRNEDFKTERYKELNIFKDDLGTFYIGITKNDIEDLLVLNEKEMLEVKAHFAGLLSLETIVGELEHE